MKWFYDGEEVKEERWQWGVVYRDGTQLHQFNRTPQANGNGTFHRIGEINQDEVVLFSLYKPDDDHKRIDIPFQKGMRLIHKYRNIRPEWSKVFIKVYMIGWKFEGKHSFIFVLPDDRIVTSPVDNIDLSLFGLDM